MVPDGIKRTLKINTFCREEKRLRKKVWMRKMNPNTRRRGMKMQKMLGMNGPRTKGNTMAITLPPTIMEVETSVKNDKFPLD